MPQITTITSEALQATIRRLLPSQRGFGQDLEATNLIQPIIDLTPTAEGSQLPLQLSEAVALGSSTNFSVTNTTTVTANTVGFWRFTGVSFIESTTGGIRENEIRITDGLSSQVVYEHSTMVTSARHPSTAPFDLTLFLGTGQTVTMVATSAGIISGSYRVIADRYGNITNPAGFTFE